MFPKKKIYFKVTPTISKTGGEGSRPLLDNVQKEAAFFGWLPLVLQLSTVQRTVSRTAQSAGQYSLHSMSIVLRVSSSLLRAG